MVVQPAGAPGGIPGIPGIPGVIPRAARGSSQEPGGRSRRDGSATSQPGGCMTPQQQQSSHSSPSSHPSAQPQQSQ